MCIVRAFITGISNYYEVLYVKDETKSAGDINLVSVFEFNGNGGEFMVGFKNTW